MLFRSNLLPGQIFERIDHKGCRREIMIGREPVRHGDALHPGIVGCQNTLLGIFENNTFVWACAKVARYQTLVKTSRG